MFFSSILFKDLKKNKLSMEEIISTKVLKVIIFVFLSVNHSHLSNNIRFFFCLHPDILKNSISLVFLSKKK